jgi:hypothetical protein
MALLQNIAAMRLFARQREEAPLVAIQLKVGAVLHYREVRRH